jgi:hypothetical protein
MATWSESVPPEGVKAATTLDGSFDLIQFLDILEGSQAAVQIGGSAGEPANSAGPTRSWAGQVQPGGAARSDRPADQVAVHEPSTRPLAAASTGAVEAPISPGCNSPTVCIDQGC